MTLAIAVLCGCGDQFSNDDYSAVHPSASLRSLNGLGAHQRMWESAGAKCMVPTKLSPLLENIDTIVLVARTFAPPGRAARDWLENWLGQREGRSVIYFGRDFDAELYYREQTLQQVSTFRQERAKQLWAQRAAVHFSRRVSEVSQDIFCRWFYRDSSVELENVLNFSGPWAHDLTELKGTWPIAVPLQPPSEEMRQRTRNAMIARFKTTAPLGNSKSSPSSHNLVFRSNWHDAEIDSAQALDAEWDRAPVAEILLASDKHTPLVTQLSSTSFPNSRILIVANGAPLLNGSLAMPVHRKIGQKIIERCLPAERVALLVYDEAGILISNIQEKDPRVAGLEILTIWPLSVLTMHAALLGILMCMVLIPVLGRPQHLPQRALSDFGHHVEAMGKMLHQTGDSHFAHTAIADYFRSVRGETVPAWAQHPIPDRD